MINKKWREWCYLWREIDKRETFINEYDDISLKKLKEYENELKVLYNKVDKLRPFFNLEKTKEEADKGKNLQGADQHLGVSGEDRTGGVKKNENNKKRFG